MHNRNQELTTLPDWQKLSKPTRDNKLSFTRYTWDRFVRDCYQQIVLDPKRDNQEIVIRMMHHMEKDPLVQMMFDVWIEGNKREAGTVRPEEILQFATKMVHQQ